MLFGSWFVGCACVCDLVCVSCCVGVPVVVCVRACAGECVHVNVCGGPAILTRH